MKKSYFKLIYIFLIVFCTFLLSCSDDDIPITSSGTNSSYYTVVFESSNVDSIYYGAIMIPRTFNGVFDFRNSDSISVSFKANTIQVSDSSLLKVIIWGDSSYVNLMDLQISCNWQTGNFDYRYATASPKRKLSRIQYFLVCNTSSSFLAVRNLKILKKYKLIKFFSSFHIIIEDAPWRA